MSDGSAIEWTDATWNPVRGCTKVSPASGGVLVARPPAPPSMKRIRKLIAEAGLPELEQAIRGIKDVEIDVAAILTEALSRRAALVAEAPGAAKTKGGRSA